MTLYYWAFQRFHPNFCPLSPKLMALLQNKVIRYDVSNPKTYKREIDALVAASKETFCTELYLITDSLRETININEDVKINVIPAYQWLLEN